MVIDIKSPKQFQCILQALLNLLPAPVAAKLDHEVNLAPQQQINFRLPFINGYGTMEHIACFQENPSIGLKFWYNICTTNYYLKTFNNVGLTLFTFIYCDMVARTCTCRPWKRKIFTSFAPPQFWIQQISQRNTKWLRETASIPQCGHWSTQPPLDRKHWMTVICT